MLRLRLHAFAVLCLALAVTSPAEAARIVTLETPSRFVDPAKSQSLYNSPGGEKMPTVLKANAYLPDDYDRHPKARFPVLYLLHGQGDAYDTWAKPAKGDVVGVAKGFPGIIVMPEGDRGFYTNWWNGGARGDPQWERYHLDELIPSVEGRLRIRRGRRSHAIAGLSMGGLGALFYAGQRPGYFGSAASFSGAISIQRATFQSGFPLTGQRAEPIWGDPRAQEFYWAGHNPTELTENLRRTRVYVTVGDGTPGADPDEVRNYFGQLSEQELRQQAEEFVAAAKSAGVEVTYKPRQGIHDWPYWRRHLADAIGWGFFEPVTERPAAWTYRTVARFGEMWGLRFAFAAPPGEVETFKLDGRRLSATGSGTVTIRVPRAGKLTATLPFERTLPRPRKKRR